MGEKAKDASSRHSCAISDGFVAVNLGDMFISLGVPQKVGSVTEMWLGVSFMIDDVDLIYEM